MNQRVRDAMWIMETLGTALTPSVTYEELGALAERLQRQRLERGQVLFKDGREPDGVWILTSGAVELSVKAGRARRIIQILKRGDTAGDAYLLLGIDPPCTARVVEEGEAFFINGQDVRTLIQRHAAICAVWLYNLACRVIQSRTRILEVLGESLRERVALVLTEEAQDHVLRLPQKAIAEMLGVQRTSLNKILKSFEAEALVELSYGKIVITNEKELLAIASSGDRTLTSFLLEAKDTQAD